MEAKRQEGGYCEEEMKRVAAAEVLAWGRLELEVGTRVEY